MAPTTDTTTASNRFETSTADDIEAFVPNDADALVSRPTEQTPHLLATDAALYNAGVHCTSCYCGVAVVDRETGETSCPNCGWSSEGGN